MEINVDKIKEGLDKATVYTVKKTGEIMSLAKLKVKKTELRGKIQDAYKEIGKLVYDGSKTEEDISERLKELTDKTDGLLAELDECLEAINTVKE